ncbi:MAG: hypothetical protein H5T64_10650 [Chloroflexi bacterium]|nr:hypothetical protein [Chloroflexota bacterium]
MPQKATDELPRPKQSCRTTACNHRRAYPTTLYLVSFLIALSLVLVVPPLSQFSRAIPDLTGDGNQYLYLLKWFPHALFGLHASLFFDPNVFYPFGYPLAMSETTLANTVLMMPIVLSVGEVIAYNSAILSSCALAGLGAYLFAWQITRCKRESVVAAVVFAFAPYHTAHIVQGILPIITIQWIPFVFLGIEMLARQPRGQWILLTALFFALTALSSWYYAFIISITAGAYALLRAWGQPQPRQTVTYALLSLMLAAFLILPALVPTFLCQGGRGWSMTTSDGWGAALTDFIYPNPRHPLWGPPLLENYTSYTRRADLYVGIPVLLLASVGLRAIPWANRRALIMTAVLATLLALGPTLHVYGPRTYIPVPAMVERAFTVVIGFFSKYLALNPTTTYYTLRLENAIYVPLPAFLLYLFVPTGNAIRFWSRFGVVAILVLAVLAVCGARRLGEAFRVGHTKQAWAEAAIALCVIAILCDFVVAPELRGFRDVGPDPVTEWIRSQPGDFSIMKFPIEVAINGRSLYETFLHGKKIAYGYGTFFPGEWTAQLPVLRTFPSGESLALLKRWSVRYILIYPEAYGSLGLGEPSQIVGLEALPLRTIIDDVWIYELIDSSQPAASSGITWANQGVTTGAQEGRRPI